ncbi:two-component sensor histidine kinase [Paraliobacillus quinghaiensis]|uniref:histidine kinase n=2 Tax=Paraliobacillus quinghaiensis TaxID=470815 RepID=A0A917TD81_9BACI|nr:HAMP domain-containing sensor histidine kinase [Paraliobacillus quinghaiensis]GGM19275.1 two-component sensor histidine kinase [Paraliobacillus quinghaiensis]
MLDRLSFRIGSLFFILLIAVLSFFYLLLYSNLVNDRVGEVFESVLDRGNAHSAVLGDYFNPTTLEHVALMEESANYSVVITDREQQIIEQSNQVSQKMREVISREVSNKQNGSTVFDDWANSTFIATVSPIVHNDKLLGYVYMFADTNYIQGLVQNLQKQFLVIGGISLLITLVIVLLLSRLITLPVRQMKDATTQLREGKEHVPLQVYRRDELGELAKAISGLSTDLTRLKKERNDFLSSISHELRTPLTYVKGYAEIAQRSTISETERAAYLDIIRQEVEALTRMIQQLFDLAKLDSNQFEISRREVLLCDVIKQVVDRVTPAFEANGHKLQINCPGGIEVFIDPDRFNQVMWNVLDNARKYLSDQGTVKVEVIENVEEVCINVQDNGIGIEKEALKHLFTRFYRVEKSRSRKTGGTGLGLAIVKEIIDAHQGTISIESELGEGTFVSIKLPKY